MNAIKELNKEFEVRLRIKQIELIDSIRSKLTNLDLFELLNDKRIKDIWKILESIEIDLRETIRGFRK